MPAFDVHDTGRYLIPSMARASLMWYCSGDSNPDCTRSERVPSTSWSRAVWSATRDSNPRRMLGRHSCYHYTSGAWSQPGDSNSLPPVYETGAQPYVLGRHWQGDEDSNPGTTLWRRQSWPLNDRPARRLQGSPGYASQSRWTRTTRPIWLPRTESNRARLHVKEAYSPIYDAAMVDPQGIEP